MTELTAAASALIVHGDRILFVRSTRTQHRWAFPGGRREKNETPQENAVREVMEEVGLAIRVTRALGKYVIAASGFEITCFAATAATMDLKLDANEILEARWCTIDEGLQLDLISTVREALLEFRRTSAA
jgi:8-oxo-dGTP pyrophosphatase MutT (NUDIX family)